MSGSHQQRILIISASLDAEDMRLRLTDAGFHYPQICDFAHALESIRAALPDLILLARQPGLSSLSQLNKIHRQFPRVPVVMVCSSLERDIQEHIAAGATDYIYYVGAERELLPFVVERALEKRLNAAMVEASAETAAMFHQLEQDQQSGFRVQQAMLPNSPASIQGLTFNHQLYPSMIMSGDFIDYFELKDGRIAFYIADVSGHGASSAFVTVLLKSLSQRLLEEVQAQTSTADILGWLNAELMQWGLEQHVAMFLGVIDESRNLLDYSNAAHFPGTILCRQGEAPEFLEIGGQPLGLFSEPTFSANRITLPDSYAIVMFSDGVFEILPQASLAEKEARLLSLVECFGGENQQQQDLDGLIDDLGVLDARMIPDDIAVFTVQRTA